MGFFRQEYWSGLPFPSTGDLPYWGIKPISLQFSSTTQSCPALCDPMDCSKPDFLVHRQLLELAQPHIHQVHEAIQPSHSLLSPSPSTFNLSQHQSLFISDGQSIGASASASIFTMDVQDWFPLGWAGWISLQSKGLSRVFSNNTVQKHQFFSAQLSL